MRCAGRRQDRPADGGQRDFGGFSELSVRANEFTAVPDGITGAYVIENEITYLAFPVPVASMAILGGGYAVPVLEPLGWLAGLDVVYWGDIDTRGFAILVSGADAPSVRLEQERISFSAIERAVGGCH